MKISVVTACFNSIGTIRCALDSVRSQRYPRVEHVVVDGGSTDGTWGVIQAHGSPLVVAQSEPDRGIYDALNKGLARATGDVIGVLHADDVFADAEVLGWVAAALADPAVDAVFGDLQYVDKNDLSRVIRHWRSGPFSARRLAWGWMPPHPTLYLRRSVYDRLGGFDTGYRIAADYDLILRLFSQPGVNAVHLPHVLVRMRVGGASNKSLANIVRKSREDLRALRRHNVGGLHTLAWKNLSKLGQYLGRG